MSYFKQKASQLICPRHLKKITHLSIKPQCPTNERAQCQSCIDQDFSMPLNDVDQLMQRFTKDNETIKVMSALRTDLQNAATNLKKMIDFITNEIESQIQILNVHPLPIAIAEWYSDADMRLPNLQQLGEVIYQNLIKIDNEFQLKQPVIKDLQQKPIKASINQLNEVFEILKTLIKEEKTMITSQPKQYEIIREIKENRSMINQISVNYTGQFLAVAMEGAQNNLSIWQLDKYAECSSVTPLTGHTNNVQTVCFSKKCNVLLSGSSDNTIRIWELDKEQWKQTALLAAHTWVVWCVSLNSNEDQIASASSDKTVRIWRQEGEGEWKCSQTIKKHMHTVLCVAYNKEGTLLASCGWDKSIIVYRMQDDVWTPFQSMIEHNDKVTQIIFNKSDVISASMDKSIRVWRLVKDNYICIQILQNQEERNNQIGLSFDFLILVSSGEDGNVNLHTQLGEDSWKCQQKLKVNGPVNCLRFSKQYLIVSCGNSVKILRQEQK